MVARVALYIKVKKTFCRNWPVTGLLPYWALWARENDLQARLKVSDPLSTQAQI
jgi:hypothetical protein